MRARAITAVVALFALALPATALAKPGDRDRDGMPDKWEKRNGLNPKKNDARRDRDRDGLRNIDEFRAGTDPRNDDTDGDGVKDGDEGAGTIASFNSATGELVIDLFGGGTLTGTVDATTEIECEDADDDRPNARRGSDAGSRSGSAHAADDATRQDGRNGANDDGNRSGPNSGPSDHAGDENDDEGNCSTADLTAGRAVDEAELNDDDDDGPTDVFDEIELR